MGLVENLCYGFVVGRGLLRKFVLLAEELNCCFFVVAVVDVYVRGVAVVVMYGGVFEVGEGIV